MKIKLGRKLRFVYFELNNTGSLWEEPGIILCANKRRIVECKIFFLVSSYKQICCRLIQHILRAKY